jgi:hypothetical protein
MGLRQTLSSRVHNGADIVDSRDIIKRIEELDGEIEGCATCGGTGEVKDGEDADKEAEDCDVCQSDREERKVLQDLVDEIDNADNGRTLIKDSYFRTYAQDYASDIGALPRDPSWPANHIDWEAACEELQQDWSSVEWDGETYWVSS